MKATGMIRKVDELGRIVVPKEIRKAMGIDVKDPVEIFVENDAIILKKYRTEQSCMVTGEISTDLIQLYNGKIRVTKESAKDLIKELEKQLVPAKGEKACRK